VWNGLISEPRSPHIRCYPQDHNVADNDGSGRIQEVSPGSQAVVVLEFAAALSYAQLISSRGVDVEF